jgi:SAM-dependent methyltransferase
MAAVVAGKALTGGPRARTMATKHSYREYVTDRALLDQYEAYQQRYRDSIRESDKILVELIRGATQGRPASLLDIGCSTGNLLRHVRRLLPELRLTGADLSQSAVEKCRADPGLADISFGVFDMLDLSPAGRFDVIVANAVTVYFDWPDYRKAIASVFAALEPGGSYLAFEWLHPFSVQDLTIIETNDWNPEGLKLCFRPIPKVETLLREIGFASVEFRPFELPIDLPFPGHDADVVTYTRKDERGHRMAFRGALYQPWCHMIARKA